MQFLKNNISLIFLFILSLPAIWALFVPGFYGASDDLHIAWLYEMDRLIKIGQFPPRFVPDLSFGFGYPLFNFVFPLPFYIGEVFHILGLSLVDSVKTVFGISLICSAFSMYFLLKEFLSPKLALVGSLLFLYTPYRSTDVYVRGAIGESMSFVFLPLILFAVIRIYKETKDSQLLSKNIFILSLSIAALILSHNIVSYMFMFFVVLIIIILTFYSENKKHFVSKTFFGLLGGFLISIYFWLPALRDSDLMKYETVFNYIDHFPTLKQLITPRFGYGASVAGPYDGMSFFVGIPNLAAIFVGVFLCIKFWKKLNNLDKTIIVWSVVSLLISLFMMNHRSVFIWESLPFLPYFQFPWRFLTMVSLLSPLFLLPLKHIKAKSQKLILGIFLISTLFSVKYFKPHDFLQRTDSYYLNRYIPTPVASEEYKKTQEEYLRLSKSTDLRPDKNYPLVFSDHEFLYNNVETDGLNIKLNVETPQELILSYSKYNFPGWYAILDGKKVSVSSGKPFGQVSLVVPKGTHTLELVFKETPINKLLNFVSGVSFFGSILLLVKENKKILK